MDDIIFYVEYPKTQQQKESELTNEFSRVGESKVSKQNHLHLYTVTTNNWKRNYESKSVYSGIKKNKTLGN
jgi:hypothetical protein